jgi:F0F1-type ATP synthase membrane subunit b/b'
MDQNLVENINIETNRIKNELEQLYKRYERLMTNEHLILASTILKQINNLVESISETEAEEYWQSIEKEYQKKKKTLKATILKMSQEANAKLFEHNISESIEIYETIINKLKNICNDTLVN